MGKKRGLFSADIHLVPTDRPLMYDLYINSSGHHSRNNFVKVAMVGRTLSLKELEEIQKKFHQIYILEEHRGNYLRSLIALDSISDNKKGEVVK